MSKFFTSVGLTFPGYIGSMLVAAVIRNISDHSHGSLLVPMQELGTVGDVSLNIFLSLAMMSLRIWELFDIAGPLFIIAVAQTIFMALYATCRYDTIGKDYDAAVKSRQCAASGWELPPMPWPT